MDGEETQSRASRRGFIKSTTSAACLFCLADSYCNHRYVMEA